MKRRLVFLLAGAIGAAAAIWLLASAGGTPADCAPACDCESIGSGWAAQPANAWTATAIVAAGIWVASAGRGRVIPGLAVMAVGLASFAAHASVTGWAYRAEGAVLAAAAWGLALHRRPRPMLVAAVVAGALAWMVGMPAVVGTVAAAAIVLALYGIPPQASPALVAVSALLLGGGSLLRWLADDGGPWCRPAALLPGHAVWHLLAAAGLGILASVVGGPTGPDSARSALRSDAAQPTGPSE